MSIGGAMRTSTSGMNAQANRLSAVSENIANANTTGYKRVTTEFSSLILPSSSGLYNSGMVQTQTRTLISQQGGLTYTTNSSSSQAIDLAINGKGFMIVGDGEGGSFLTRAGSFVKNGNGDLVNAAGYVLQGYPLPEGDTNGVANGFAGLVNVNLNAAQLRLKPTDKGLLTVNLPKSAATLPTYTGTTGAATSGTATQAAAFSATGTTSVAGDKLTMTVTVDGVDYDVEVIATAANGVAGLTIADVAAAINAKVGETVAYDSGSGELKLLSQATGTGSIVAMTAAAVEQADGTARSGITLAGLAAILATASGATGTAEARTTTSNTLPSENAAAGTAAFTAKESMVVYDNTGAEVILDIYMTKTNHNQWEYAVYDRAQAGTGSTAPFPYKTTAITSGAMTFDTSGNLKTPANAAIDIAVPNGETMRLSLEGTTQLTGKYQTLASSVNGNPPENVDKVSISADGIVKAEFKSGASVNLFKIPLALVESPDNMTALPGNVFSAGLESGTVLVGFGTESGLGSLVAGALEESTVDLASELTTMIESQRSYTANSKVFQTGSEILDVLVNLKR
jgi:flagellar hook-basal body protein